MLLVLNLNVYLKGVWDHPPGNSAKIGTKSCNFRGFHEFMGLHIEVHSCVTIRGVNYINICII